MYIPVSEEAEELTVNNIHLEPVIYDICPFSLILSTLNPWVLNTRFTSSNLSPCISTTIFRILSNVFVAAF